MLGLLLRQRVRLFWNRLGRGPRRTRRVLGAFLATVFTIGFVVLAGLNAGLLLDRIASTDPLAATETLPVLLIGVFALTLVTSLSSAFHHLFLAGDLELLLAAPVPARSLFWLKVFEIWRDSLHVLLFQAAALYGFGQTLRLPGSYYFLAALVGLSLTLAATAIGATVTLALARVRFGESILGLSRLLAVLLFLPIGILGVPAFGFGRGRDFRCSSARATSTRLPRRCAALVPRRRGRRRPGLRTCFWATRRPVCRWCCSWWPGRRLRGCSTRLRWSVRGRLGASSLLGPRRRSSPLRFGRRLPGGAPDGPIVGLLQKDWRTLVRDPRWRTGALVSLVALGLPAMALFAGDPFARTAHALRFWLGMLPVPYLAYLFGSQQGAATWPTRAATSRCCGPRPWAWVGSCSPKGLAAWCWSWA